MIAVPTQFLDVSSGGSETSQPSAQHEQRGRASESPVHTLARLEARVDISPDCKVEARFARGTSSQGDQRAGASNRASPGRGKPGESGKSRG